MSQCNSKVDGNIQIRDSTFGKALSCILAYGTLLNRISPSQCLTANSTIAEALGELLLLFRVPTKPSPRMRQNNSLVRSESGLLGECCVRVESLELKELY